MLKAAKQITTTATESLEKEFQKIYQDLLVEIGDPESPSDEFQKLQELWRKSRENESRLGQRCRELQAQMAANKARALASAARSKEDQAMVATLKKEIEKAWKMVDDAHEKDQVSRDTIQGLQRELDHLNRIVDQGSSLSLTQERLAELQRIKEELSKNNESLQNEVTDLRETLSTNDQMMRKLQQESTDHQLQLTKALESHQEITVQLQREVRLKEQVEIDFRQARADAEVNANQLKAVKIRLEEIENQMETLELKLKEKQRSFDQLNKELENVKTQLQQSRHDNEMFRKQVTQLTDDIKSKMVDIKMNEDETKKYYSEYVKLVKLRDSLNIRLLKSDEQNTLLLQQIDTLKNEIYILEKENSAAKKQVADDQKLIDGLTRQRNSVKKNLMKTMASCVGHLDQLKVQEEKHRSQQQEIMNLKEEIDKQSRNISQIEKERIKIANENCNLRLTMIQEADERKAVDLSLFDCRKKLADSEGCIVKLRRSYDTLKSERDFYERNLVEKQDEMANLRRKLKQITHSVNQLNENIADKENELYCEREMSRKRTKDITALRLELKRATNRATDAHSSLKTHDIQVTNIRKLVDNIEQEKVKKGEIIEKLTNEKNHLATVVIQREDEVRSLTDRLHNFECSLSGSVVEHRSVVADVRLLKLEVKRLTTENRRLESGVETIQELQNEIFRLGKDLMRERLKSRALEDELENPHNIHRWRRLAGSDPTVYDLLQKVHVLQKRLISKNERQLSTVGIDVESRHLKLEAENEKVRRSSSAAAGKLLAMQQQLRDKEKMLKSLTSEQEVNLTRIDAYKREIEDVKQNLRDSKYQVLILSRTAHLQTSNSPDTDPIRTRNQSVPSTVGRSVSSGLRTQTLGSGFRIVSVLPVH